MKKLLLVTLLLGATYATTHAQRRGHDHDRYPQRTVYSERGYYDHDDDDDDRRRGRGNGHYKHKKYKYRDYRRNDCYREERVVVVRPRYPYPPPPPPRYPRRPRVSGVIVFGN